jgi:predicted Abi (CAAX) family protease
MNVGRIQTPAPLLRSNQTTAPVITAAEDAGRCWKPTTEWAGRLVLPSAGERREGGVYLQVLQAPGQHAGLKGKKVWLNFQEAGWVERVTTDVEFSKRTEKSKGMGHVHPDRINGWGQVSPLESLAGARPQDDVLVSLKNPKLVGGELRIEREPVQVSGTHKALVTFEEKIDAHTWKVRHYNPETKQFDGPSQEVRTQGRGDLAPMADRRANSKGWYLYAEPDSKGTMVVAALEPKELFDLPPDQMIRGQEASSHYLRNENWRLEAQCKGQMGKTLLVPSESSQEAVPSLSRKAQELFKLGDQALVLHLFGGAVGAPAMMGIYAGHFSFGLAKVVTDEFTQEPRFEVEYKQVYAHNKGGVISGSQQWHAYMGDTTRGYLYDRPVTDALIPIPELFDDSKGTVPSEILEQRLEEVMARYRSGHGDGSSQVTAAQNCSQDSSQALYAAGSDWKKAITEGKLNPGLETVAAELASHLTPLFGLAPREWKKTANNEKVGQHTFRWIPAFKSPKTILPRKNFEALADMALDKGRPVMLVKTDVLGADNPETIPSAPFG